MDKKVTGIVAYLTIIGWFIAFLAGDKEGAKFHLNQALVLTGLQAIVGVVQRIIAYTSIPFVGLILWLVSVVILVFQIIGFIYACKGEDKAVPLFGSIKIMK